MTINATLESLGYNSPDGSIWKGAHRQVISGVTANTTRPLLTSEAGALVLFDNAAGMTYTLPAPSTLHIGAFFDFATTVTITSNNAKSITDAATTFLVGAVLMGSIATASPGGFSANGTTIRAVTSNGSTTGGIIGDAYRVTLISATVWQINGVLVGSGTLATPFATS